MSWKTLIETLEGGDDLMTSPLDFQKDITIIAVPNKMMEQPPVEVPESPEGTTLQLPDISKTSEVSVPKESTKHFKGDHKHLSTDDLKTLITWVEEQSKADTVPPEARAQLLEWYKNLVVELNARSEEVGE